ncbi:hypothetical protein ACROYT_G038245 [Oculina patagonica]
MSTDAAVITSPRKTMKYPRMKKQAMLRKRSLILTCSMSVSFLGGCFERARFFMSNDVSASDWLMLLIHIHDKVGIYLKQNWLRWREDVEGDEDKDGDKEQENISWNS